MPNIMKNLSCGKVCSRILLTRNHKQAGNVATIELKGIKEECELVMFDGLGREVKRINIIPGTLLVMLDNRNLENGTYFYNLFSNDRVVAKGRIIIT